jgi:hypothetical protein
MIGVQIADLLEKMSIECGGDLGHGIQQIAQAEKMWEQKQLEIVSAFSRNTKKKKTQNSTLKSRVLTLIQGARFTLRYCEPYQGYVLEQRKGFG